MKDLAAEVKGLWAKEKIKFERELDDWLGVLEQGKKTIRRARKGFHQWDPLRVYVSVTKVRSSNSRARFSLRFYGQELGELCVRNGRVALRLTKPHSENNQRFFRCELSSGDYDWNGQEARRFRSFFKEKAVTSHGKPNVKSIEHRVESKFIQEMLKGVGKFGVSGLEIQPVTISGCPLQFPVPIAANTGQPKPGHGNIDILARHRGKDKKTRLSIWELKKPHVYGHPASQAYIYALTFLHILRHTKNGSRWYRLFGYRSPIPKSLEIEAVVAITSDQEKKFCRERDELQKSTSLDIDGDKIELYAAYYIEESHSIEFEADPFG
jgi:hypothetical protein